MKHYTYVQNRECEYFPCHAGGNRSEFNCLFCFCPLYALGDRCGGSFTYTPEGIKDCSQCLKPHMPGNYEKIMEKIPELLELARKKEK